MENRKKIIVLSLDGGGTRMILQYIILKRIMEKFPSFLQSVNVFAGVSAGSLLASALLLTTPRGLDRLFINENVERIFRRSYSKKITSLGGLIHSKYSNEHLRDILNETFGDISFETLSQLSQKIFIPVFRVDGKEDDGGDEDQIQINKPKWLNRRVKRWHTVYYDTIDICDNNKDRSVRLNDVIMESSAAPCYFPIFNGCIDGGVSANNPSLCILARLISLGYDIKDIYILSLGTGEKPSFLDVDDASQGFIQWAPRLLDVILDASSEVTSENAYKILGNGFWRIQPVLPESIRLDDASKYEQLVAIAENFNMENTFGWIEQLLN